MMDNALDFLAPSRPVSDARRQNDTPAPATSTSTQDQEDDTPFADVFGAAEAQGPAPEKQQAPAENSPTETHRPQNIIPDGEAVAGDQTIINDKPDFEQLAPGTSGKDNVTVAAPNTVDEPAAPSNQTKAAVEQPVPTKPSSDADKGVVTPQSTGEARAAPEPIATGNTAPITAAPTQPEARPIPAGPASTQTVAATDEIAETAPQPQARPIASAETEPGPVSPVPSQREARSEPVLETQHSATPAKQDVSGNQTTIEPSATLKDAAAHLAKTGTTSTPPLLQDQPFAGLQQPTSTASVSAALQANTAQGAVNRADLPPAVQQVAGAINAIQHGQNRIEVRLDPPDLGRVYIDFTFDGERALSAVVSADQQETSALLRRHAEMLMRELMNAGFDGVNLTFHEQTDSNQHFADEDTQLINVAHGSADQDAPITARPALIADGQALDLRL